ncbi:putative F-box/LRR-repeat protein At5g02700 [Brachypodium distachyon]|uniref:putative F-box/LRR-repeat protein At5g02700 n=1 Tax=Brachypodium distachyon TaxID=15368 RepID=UPI000234F5FB|nr:putative F-box/LRR-repeat protein At5g02700 [Brachypodium distachyon]|eukprot:XP_024318893.1 putative F-box/LRR-repeat protein At5g02700 [Brachypodium distachyon]
MEVQAPAAGSPARSTRKRKAEEPPTHPGVVVVVVGAGEEDGVDRVSNLSDDNLRKVISFLPMKDGACTTMLASRWRHLWCSAPLNINCRDLRAGAVAQILDSRLDPVRSITIFPESLIDPTPTLDDLLQSTALDKLEELDLWYHVQLAPPKTPPSSAFRFSPTLRVLTIRACCLPDGSIQGLHFPVLKQLELKMVTLSGDSLRYMVASCCPALKWLLLDSCSGFASILINSLSLVSIRVCTFRYDGMFMFEELIIESAPSLRRLLMHGRGMGKRVSVISAPKLEAMRCIVDKEQQPATKISFSSMVIQGLQVDNLMLAVRTVRILSLEMDPLSLDIVLNWLRCFPCLEKLYIQATGSGGTNLWRRKYKNLTRCLDIPLKTIAMETYRGIKSHVSFVTFFVLNVTGLESITLSIRAVDNTEEFLTEQRIKLELDNNDARLHFTTHSCVRTTWDILSARDLDLADPLAVI